MISRLINLEFGVTTMENTEKQQDKASPVEAVVSFTPSGSLMPAVLTEAILQIHQGNNRQAVKLINEAQEMLKKLQILFEEVSHHYDIDVYDLHYDKWTETGGY